MNDLVEQFTEEIIKQDPKWVADRRCEYLSGKIMKIYHRISWWLMKYTGVWWWDEAIIESVVNPLWESAKLLEREIEIYQAPKPINYEKITEYDIERASSVNCSSLIETKRKGTLDWAVCPFHDDKNPSMACYEGNRGFYCFSCNTSGNAIDLYRKLYNRTFEESVRELLRF
jgi:hypothetical protein